MFLSDLYLKVSSQPELELSLETNRSSAPRGLTLWEMPKGCMKDEMVSFTSAQKCERRQFYEEEEAVLPHCFLLFVCLFPVDRKHKFEKLRPSQAGFNPNPASGMG